jgi:hypothetical protein
LPCPPAGVPAQVSDLACQQQIGNEAADEWHYEPNRAVDDGRANRHVAPGTVEDQAATYSPDRAKPSGSGSGSEPPSAPMM